MNQLKFITIAVTHEEAEFLTSSLERKRQKDEDWIKIFLVFLIEFYQSINNKSNYKNQDERYIKDEIIEYYKRNLRYGTKFTFNLETKTENRERIGYYDLKFQSEVWEANQKYFAVEAKCLDGSNTSIKEYIHNQKKKKGIGFTDGGVYRFLSLKYSENMIFGGMLGFIQKGKSKDIVERIQKELSELGIEMEGCQSFGNNLNKNRFSEKIEDFSHSFLSEHERCFNGKKGKNIKLYHLFYDFNLK